MGKIYYKDVSYGGGGSSTLDGSIVGVEQIQKSGNLIAIISVDEDDTNIYSPLPPLIDVDVNDVSVLDSVTQTAKVYTHKSLTKAEYEAIPSSVSHFSNIIYAITDEPKLYLNGIEYNGTGGGQTSVIVSPIATEGTKIASISVDGLINDIYAPNNGDEYVAGDNIVISTFSGQPSTISAVNTTYSAFTSTAAGLVPPPTTAVDMFLKSDGTWSEAGVGNVIDVYENGVSVLDENNIAQTHSYKEITQAEYDALYPPGSTVTDNILYAIKDGEGGSGGGGASALADLNDVDISTPTDNQVLQYDSTSQKWINATSSGGGGNVDDVYVNGISVLDSNHIAQVKTHKEITASDYNELTTEQKNDGTLYLINGISGITVPVEGISIGKYIESAYVCQDEVTEDETGVISYFYGGSQIGNDFWLVDKVDVTNYTYIKYDLELGTCYGTSSANWYYTVGLMSSVPNDWIYAGDSRYVVKNSYTTQERSYTDETLDVSNLAGEYYIIVVAHGWNATFNNIRLVSEDVQPNRIYFMDTEFANNVSGGGSGGSGCTKTLLWDYVTDNNGNIPYDPFNFTLHDNINNYDLLLIENVSFLNDLSNSDWKSTTQFFVDVNALNNAYEPNYVSYTSFNERSSRYYIKDTTFQKTINNDGYTNGLVKVWGLKLDGGGGSGSNTLLYQGDGVSNSSQITLSDDYTNYDMLIIRTLRSADGRMYKTDKTFNVLGLNNNDFIQDIGWNPDNNYWTYQISDSTTLNKISEGYNYFLYEIYGVKL